MKDVAVVACRDYEKETVSEAVGRALDLLGGLSAFIRPGMKVCIKPNLMRKINPESCLITHPSLVAEVARRCIALGAKVTVAESPGGHYTEAVMRGIYRATGVSEALEGTGAKLDTSCETREVALPGAVVLARGGEACRQRGLFHAAPLHQPLLCHRQTQLLQIIADANP